MFPKNWRIVWRAKTYTFGVKHVRSTETEVFILTVVSGINAPYNLPVLLALKLCES